MKKSQEEKDKSYRLIKQGCNGYASVWNTNVPFTNSFNKFTNKISELEDQFVIQSETLTGISEDKQNARGLLEAEVNYFIAVVKAYAYITVNNALCDGINANESRVKSMRANDLYKLAGDVFKVAEANLSNLTAYGINQLKLDNFEECIEKFNTLINAPREAMLAKARATRNIAELIKEIDEILKNELDNLVKIFVPIEPDFPIHYFNWREINHLPTRKMALRGKVVDKETQQPLSKVKIRIKETQIKRKTSESGVFEVINLKQGTHEIQLEHANYQPTIHTVTIIFHQFTKVVIEMEKK